MLEATLKMAGDESVAVMHLLLASGYSLSSARRTYAGEGIG